MTDSRRRELRPPRRFVAGGVHAFARVSRTSAFSASGVIAPLSTSRRALRSSGSRASTAPRSLGGVVRGLDVAARVAPQAHVSTCRKVGARVRHGTARSPRRPFHARHRARPPPRRSAARLDRPKLSWIQSSAASRPRCRCRCPRTRTARTPLPPLRVAREVEAGASAAQWFAEASPNVQHDDRVGGQLRSRRPAPRARDRDRAPTAFGRCEAIVLVCGGTHSGREPHTLWRPPEIGSSADATSESNVSNTGVPPGSLRARASISPHRSGSAGGTGSVGAEQRAEHDVVLVARAADRVEAAVRTS
jgi:hypothetical protein